MNISNFNESITANANLGGSTTCNASGTTSCYLSKTWTVSNTLDITKTYNIYANGRDITNSTTA